MHHVLPVALQAVVAVQQRGLSTSSGVAGGMRIKVTDIAAAKPRKRTQDGSKGGGRSNARDPHHGRGDLAVLLAANEVQQAWAFFHNRIGARQATVHDCNMMLKACYTSTQARELVSVTMVNSGVQPNVATYTLLVTLLLLDQTQVSL